MDLVVCSLIFRRIGGFFVDFSSIWWFFRGFFVDLVVLLLLFEGSRVPRGSSEKKQPGGPCHFSLKMRRAYIQNCVSCVGGDDIFRKIMKKVIGK